MTASRRPFSCVRIRTLFVFASTIVFPLGAQQVLPPSSNGFAATVTATPLNANNFFGEIAMWDYDPQVPGSALNQPLTGDVYVGPAQDGAQMNCYSSIFTLRNACASKPAGRFAQPFVFTVDPVESGKTYVFGTFGWVFTPVTWTVTISDNGTTTTFTRTMPAVSGTVPFFSYTPRPRQGVFNFDLTAAAAGDPEQARLLTHVYRHDTDPSGQPLPSSSFFSFYQVDPSNTIPPNSPNPQMRLDGTVSNPPSTNRIWFKLVDPEDPSAYAAGDRHAGDNRDRAALIFVSGAQVRQVDLAAGDATSPPLQASWDTDHRVHLIVQGSDHVSGDNYRVIASFEAPNTSTQLFPCETNNTCSASPVITVWKRIYIEADQMFRAGAFIAANTDLTTAEVEVTDASMFHAGQTVRLIHGSPFNHGVGGGGAFGDTSFSEDATVLTPSPNDPIPAVYRDQTQRWHIRLTAPLNHFFRQSPIVGVDTFADAVGVVTGNPLSDVYASNPTLLPAYFASMYVDVAFAPQTVPEFPYIDIASSPNQMFIILTAHLRWFQNANRGATGTNVAAFPNHMHMISASRIAFTPNCSTNYGDTVVSSGNNVSWIYQRRIEDAPLPIAEAPCNGYSLPTAARDPLMVSGATVAHELTHQWQVNHIAGYCGGHCAATPSQQCPHQQASSQSSYLGNGDVCLMSETFPGGATPAQIDLGRLTLHYVNHGVDSEYITIRTTAEPIPQQ